MIRSQPPQKFNAISDTPKVSDQSPLNQPKKKTVASNSIEKKVWLDRPTAVLFDPDKIKKIEKSKIPTPKKSPFYNPILYEKKPVQPTTVKQVDGTVTPTDQKKI